MNHLLPKIEHPEKGKSYLLGRQLGSGSFAAVYEAAEAGHCGGTPFAIKVVAKEGLTHESRAKLDRQIQIHGSLDHPHIVKLKGHFQNDKHHFLVLELCARQTLSELLKRRRVLTEMEAQFYLRQLARALTYLHENHIVHRDIKLANLFLTDKLHLKLGDFGLAASTREQTRRHSICGTPNFMAPEIVARCEEGHSLPADVWSFGVLAYAMLIGVPPFQTVDVQTTYTKIKKEISEQARHLIQDSLRLDPSRRPLASQLQDYQFFSMSELPLFLPLSTLICQPNEKFMAQCKKAETPARKKSLGACFEFCQQRQLEQSIMQFQLEIKYQLDQKVAMVVEQAKGPGHQQRLKQQDLAGLQKNHLEFDFSQGPLQAQQTIKTTLFQQCIDSQSIELKSTVERSQIEQTKINQPSTVITKQAPVVVAPAVVAPIVIVGETVAEQETPTIIEQLPPMVEQETPSGVEQSLLVDYQAAKVQEDIKTQLVYETQCETQQKQPQQYVDQEQPVDAGSCSQSRKAGVEESFMEIGNAVSVGGTPKKEGGRPVLVSITNKPASNRSKELSSWQHKLQQLARWEKSSAESVQDQEQRRIEAKGFEVASEEKGAARLSPDQPAETLQQFVYQHSTTFDAAYQGQGQPSTAQQKGQEQKLESVRLMPQTKQLEQQNIKHQCSSRQYRQQSRHSCQAQCQSRQLEQHSSHSGYSISRPQPQSREHQCQSREQQCQSREHQCQSREHQCQSIDQFNSPTNSQLNKRQTSVIADSPEAKPQINIPQLQFYKPGYKDRQQRKQEDSQWPMVPLLPLHEGEEKTDLEKQRVARFIINKRYGLGYLLQSGHSGAVFNDHTKLVYSPTLRALEYFDKSNSLVSQFAVGEAPLQMAKKVGLLLAFRRQLGHVAGNGLGSVAFVRKYVGEGEATLFKFSDGNIQVVYKDKSELLICPATRWLAYIGTGGSVTYHRVTETKALEPEVRRRVRILKAMTQGE